MKIFQAFNILIVSTLLFSSCRKEVNWNNQIVQGTQGTASLDSTYLKEFISIYFEYSSDTVSIEKYGYDNLKRLTSVTVVKATPFLLHPARHTTDIDTILFFYEGNSMAIKKVIRKIKSWEYTWTTNHISNPVLGRKLEDFVDTLKFTYNNFGQVCNDTVIYGGQFNIVDINRYIFSQNEIKEYGKSISNNISTGEILTTHSLTYQGPNLVSQGKDGLIAYQMVYDNMKSPFYKVVPAYSYITSKLWFTNMFWSISSSKNNIADFTSYDYSSGSPNPTVLNTHFVYSYRSDGYPRSLSRTGYLSGNDYFNKAVFLYY